MPLALNRGNSTYLWAARHVSRLAQQVDEEPFKTREERCFGSSFALSMR